MPNVEHSNDDAIREVAADYLRQLQEKILFGLSIYQFLSPTQLHVFLGTSTPSSLWKDQVLAALIADGKVISENVTLTSPFDRSQSYTVLHLPENVYTPPEPLTPADNTLTTTPRAEEPDTVAAA